MLKLIVLVLCTLGLLRVGVAQIVQDGLCNNDVNLVQNFDINQFAGVWYEVGRSDGAVRGADCSHFEFVVDPSEIQVRVQAVNANFADVRNGSATQVDGTARLNLNLYPEDPFDFWILMTDYNNFAVAFNCENISPTQRSVNIWQMGRATTYPSTLMPALMNTTLINTFGITIEMLRSIEHTEDACYILPIIEPGEPIILPGLCDENINLVQNFEAARFTGVWHEIASYESPNALNLCTRAEYTEGEGFLHVENSEVVNQTLVSIFGTATVISTDGSARLSVTLNVDGVDVSRDLLILATDYESYAISYTCENVGVDSKRVYSWILGRSRQLSQQTQAAVNSVVESEIVLNFEYYRETDQSDEACFFFPDPDPTRPVVFRGLCDMNIPAVPGFNPEAYSGIWHDIESYYSVFQTGTCRNAEYTPGDNLVHVLNTQVINQALDTVTGHAQLVSTDGSGKLEVTFPVAGTNETVSLEYWVLATDYTSYALVYSCLNLDENERQVWTWKLSRTKSLTPPAVTAISEAMSLVPVLDDRYYQPVDQSEEACFFYPQPNPGVPVVFPGICENDIPVVQNFNVNQFTGIWFEIEAYPSTQQQGNCINHAFTSGADNTIDLQSSQVTDQFLGISNGSLTSTDGSARMNIDITIDGQAISIPFWILAVDYDDYALAYSCVQLNSDFRGIYSWKLSRTRQLSANAVQAIDQAAAGVVTLGQDYFEPVDQSEEACFFLPELAPGEPVILVGQCDPNITAIPNFDAERFLGTWRLIESYPSDSLTGTCNRATFTPGADEVLDVVNYQVINQALDSTQGSAVVSVDGTGRLLVTLPNSPTPTEYLILDTDYHSYALVYSCEDINTEQRRVWSWKLSRTDSLTPEATDAINAVVNSINVLNNRYYYQIDHSDVACFYYPEPEAGKPVVFPGSCDQNVVAMPDFNDTFYLGVWYNIEMYPSAFQSGSCSNAMYNLVQGNIEVINNQVVNQALDSITGSAVLASTDGSGKLDVTFPVEGTGETVTQSLWVLDTDYDSYSIVYSCRDVGAYREVWSWKLSRSKQLTQAARERIDAVIAPVQVLENQYFWPVDQSDAGCFYFPVPSPGLPVEFPGRCSDNIPVVQNFDMARFQGVWHELSAYPDGDDLGECTRHDYSSVGQDLLALRYSNVLDLSFNVINGNLTFAPDNNNSDGRLVAYFRIFTSILDIPFWILDIDYDDYALAYSCMDMEEYIPGSDFRLVYSWKLSRRRELSPSAEIAINSTIETVDVLQHMYYEDADHSDEACFFLPEPTEEVVVFPGQCDPNITVVQDFRADDYIGRWYLIESYPSEFQTGSCNDATYSFGESGTVDVVNTQVVEQTLDTIVGSAVASADGSGKLLVTFPGASQPSEYWILDTDYSSYALVYSCANIDEDSRAVWSWKLSRTQSLTPNAIQSINQVVDSINVLNELYYKSVDHSAEGCFYFPEPDPLVEVRFRGRCDENIGVVPNFDPIRYHGLWHLIESYPSSLQPGTCNSEGSTIEGGVIQLSRSQVVNQTLETINGVATALGGNGVLDVTFSVDGVDQTFQYWILDTDYESYSLVYTCVELGEYKQVWSWKLSRYRQLSADAVTAINNVTDYIQVLDQRYYQPVDQSREGCFYYPEPHPGQPPVFPGQCEEIDVVQNFNLTAFEGLWHEVEAYPLGRGEIGQCISHQYTAGEGDTLDLQSFRVVDEALGVRDGTLGFASTDGSARLSITVNVDGSATSIPFYIVDTDYTDYALAYSCENIDADYRTVHSWKLSRSKSLSDEAEVAITSAMSAVDVIDSRYFERVDQTDAACFFLPELAPGEPVVFPGQCDLDIPVVQDFDVGRYLNRWRLIETYAAEFQSGACNEATYSAADDGSVDVYNTQVVDQLLESINGTAVLASTDGSAKLEVTFPGSPEPASYWVLATDYDSYALVYSCRNINAEQRRVWAWKLSRDRSLSAAAVASINQVVDSVNVLNERYFEAVEQSDAACFYYPQPNGGPVIFRGQCDENVAVVTDFDPTRYEGIWYDIESYPQAFQQGTCPTAEYSLAGAGVRVRNTEVRAQELHVVYGEAVLAGAEGEAKLVVTFPVAGTDLTVESPYWVLATDYENYSLVYSCVNINDEYRRVTSWKLSKTQYLSPESTAAMATAISAVPVLDQQYFEPRAHDEVACFYYPDNQGGPVVLNGQCEPDDQVNVVTDFDPARFGGIWHEVSRFPSPLQSGECTASQYEYTQGALYVTMTEVNDVEQVTLEGPVAYAEGGLGILTLDLSSSTANFVGKMYVLDVDYDDFALIYSCQNINDTAIQVNSWKLSRSKDGLSEATRERIDEIVDREENLFFRYYEDTPQSDYACFHYPQFDVLPDAINLPGPCNTTIQGIPNFEAERYLGHWFEIEKFPQPFQFGECGRADYSTGANELVVLNTQVYNRTLLAQSGTAAPSSTDGLGELTVTFVVDGVTNVANYYVLATDYDNYALVYSCRNLENNERQVSSWKLSRSRTLTAEAVSTISSVVSSTQGLLQDYYTTTDQSQEACFYIPEVDPEQSVRLRGTCDGISGQANFNMQNYLGWWHEVKSYPTGNNVGTCLSTQYQQVGNQIQFVDTQVFDLTGDVTRGTVQASNDGKLTRTLPNGDTEEIWVLATDYINYSLLFSCEQIDGEYIRVWSSMQSKSRSLSEAADAAIAAVVADNEYLIEEFFLPVDLSDGACFHYPTEQTGPRVRLPGQCDLDIPVVPSFDIVRYSGTWYQIERYPYPEVSADSTCIGTRYTYNEGSGDVTVLNWKMLDGTLNTVEGQATVSNTTAIMTVVMPVPDSESETTTADLYILDTDYVSYSLVYTCENVNQFEREVVAFKLSRTRSLPAAATTAINGYMATRQELHQPLFVSVEHDDHCEDPNSSLLLTSSLALILICYAIQMLM